MDCIVTVKIIVYICDMTIYELIEILDKVEDKEKEVFYDSTPIYSESFVFKSVDVVDDVEDDTGRRMIVLSSGLREPDDRISMN